MNVILGRLVYWVVSLEVERYLGFPGSQPLRGDARCGGAELNMLWRLRAGAFVAAEIVQLDSRR